MTARRSARELERFGYRAVSEAEGNDEAHDAHTILRLSIGLRRKLDTWKEDDYGE